MVFRRFLNVLTVSADLTMLVGLLVGPILYVAKLLIGL